MNATSIGPLVFANDRLHAVIALAAVLIVLELGGRRRPALAGALHRWGWLLLVSWIVAARLGSVLVNRAVFAVDPLSALAVWQGGFEPIAGFVGVGLVGLAALLKRPEMLRPLALAVVMAFSAHTAAGWIFPTEAQGSLPQVALTDLGGAPVRLAETGERPVVVNLWASWCPPCRREMPMMMELAEAQDDVVLRFANQGETAAAVGRYLDQEALSGEHVVLDQTQLLMEHFGLLGLPSTLFFDAEGNLAAAHTGEISRAELINRMQALQEPE
ncbi:TlpA disulfide reductase family protein [Sagittula salina]|uniref:TlpA family protein disulfide reductase n=1 Tax=Sagittula salina TaxID=2820268 RepID=A0A940MJZ1_9RHOB|nr:TlpA disulfide reductase family protein [Sagittula salina]MBP0483190.1 TlpA family protein disulfide reductase [Sagittula salina]